MIACTKTNMETLEVVAAHLNEAYLLQSSSQSSIVTMKFEIEIPQSNYLSVTVHKMK